MGRRLALRAYWDKVLAYLVTKYIKMYQFCNKAIHPMRGVKVGSAPRQKADAR